MVILYCDKCGMRVSQSDIDTGSAKALDEARAICASCSGPEKRQSSDCNAIGGMRTATPARRDSGRRLAAAGSQSAPERFTSRPSSRPLLIIAGVAGVVVLLAIVLLIAGGGDEPSPRGRVTSDPLLPEATVTSTTTPPKPQLPDVPVTATGKTTATPLEKTDYDPRAAVAASLMAAAKDYREKNPDDVWGHKDRLEDLCQRYPRTPAAEEATRLLAEWKEPPAELALTGLVAYWPFDEGSGTTVKDASGMGHDGTLVNDPQRVTGRKGKALSFSGDQHVLVAKSEKLELGASDFTLAAWVKTRQGGAILCKTHPEGKWVPNGKSFFIQNSLPMMDSGWVGSVSGSTAVGDGQWHHVAAAFQTSSKKVFFFVDGQTTGAGRLQLVGDPAGTVIKLGIGFPSNYAGEMDEVCVFGRCLTSGQVRMLMEKGVGDTPASPSVTTVKPAPPAEKEEPRAPAEPERVPVPNAPIPDVPAGSKAALRCAVYEPFDYPVGKLLEGSSGTSDMGFEGPWKRGAPIASKKMVWDSLPTAGNCVAATRNFDAYRVINKGALRDAGLLDDGATLWLSLLMSVEEANLTNVDMNIALADQPFTFYVLEKYHQRMELEKSGHGIGVAYDHSSHCVRGCVWIDGKRQPAAQSTQKFDAGPNALALIVAKITWGRAGEADAIEVYAPDRNLDPGTVVSRTSANLDQRSFTILGIQMKEEHTHVDEIRMGATYADVTSDTIAKMLHGLKVEDAVGTVERDGYRLSLGILKNLSERFDAAKVQAKKLATVGDAIASSSTFDVPVRKALPTTDGYAFAGPMGFASSSTTITSALKSVPRQLVQEKPEIVRVCIGVSDMARNLAPGDFRKDLRSLVDAILNAGAIPVLHSLPVKTVAVPDDKSKRESADRATKALYTLSETVDAFNTAIAEVAAEKKVPLVDAWHIVNAGPDAHQKYFDARGGLKREGNEAINERFLKLYRILERGIAGRGHDN